MTFIGQMLYEWLKKTYENNYRYKKPTEAQFPFQIELECGECFNVKGFSNLSNKINTQRFTTQNFLYLLLMEHLKRIGNVYIYLIYILSLAVSDEVRSNIEDSLLFLLPMLLQLLILTAKNLYFDRKRKINDNLVNNRLVTVFKEMKKFINNKPTKSKSNQLLIDSSIKISQQENNGKTSTGKKESRMSFQKKNSIQLMEKLELKLQINQQIKTDQIQNERKLILNNLANSNNIKKRQERVPIFENIRWDQVKVGDIVYLKQDELAPADLLILDACENKIQVNSINVEGNLDEQSRFSSPLTRIQKNPQNRPSGFDYKKILNGFVKYDRVQQGHQKYRGFIKLKKDPKGETFDDSQVIFREEQLKFQSYVYGLVIFAGNECWCNRQIKRVDKKSFFLSKSTMFFFLSYLSCILMSLLSWIVDAFQICQPTGDYIVYTLSGQDYLFFLLKYTRLMPMYLYLSLDLMGLINAELKHRKYGVMKKQLAGQINNSQDPDMDRFRSIQITSESHVNYKQINNFCVADLVMTEYVCFSKTGTLTSGLSKIKSILIEDKFYKFSGKVMKNNQWSTYKTNYDNLVKQNPYNIQEIEEKSYDEEENHTPKKKKTLYLNQPTLHYLAAGSKRNLKKVTNMRMQNTDEITRIQKYQNTKKLSIELVDNISSHSQISNEIVEAEPVSIEDAPENLKMNYLDDTHCKITTEQKNNVPLPFFNKVLQNSQAVTSLINLQSSPRNSLKFLKKNEQEESDLIEINNQQMKSQQIIFEVEKGKSRREDDDLLHLKQDDFYRNLTNSSKGQMYQEALLSIILCHVTNSKYNLYDDSFQQSHQISLDQELLQFVSHFDIHFLCSNEHQNKTIYIIQIKEKYHEFCILAVNQYSPKHPRLAVLVDFPKDLAEEYGLTMDESQNLDQSLDIGQCSVLIVREELNILPHYIEMDKYSRDYWGKVFQKMHIDGQRTIVYSKSYLNEQDKISYLERYEVLKQQIDQEDLLNLYSKIEKDMQIIQVVGVQETLKPDVPMTINELKQAQIKVWLLSGDDQNKVLPCAYTSGILDIQDHQVIIDDLTISEIKITIRNHLQLMNDQLKKMSKTNIEQQKKPLQDYAGGAVLNAVRNQFEIPDSAKTNKIIQQKSNSSFMKPFSVILNGKSLQVISEDSSLLCHFCFILYFSNSLIAYNITASQKAYLVHVIQNQFPGNKRVLAAGCAYNDIQMIQASDFGIQIEKELPKPEAKRASQTPKKFFKSSAKFGSSSKQSIRFNPVKKVFEQKVVLNIPTVEIMIYGIKDLLGLIFFEARIFAQVIDDLLMFTFYRALVLVYTILLYNWANCTFHLNLYYFIDLIFFQSVYLLIIQMANLMHYKYSKIGSKELMKLYSLQFTHNNKLFRQKKILSFLLKINGNSLCEATIQYFLLIQILNDMPDSNSGKIVSQITVQQIAKVNFLMIDMVKVFVSTNFTLKIKVQIFFCYFTAFVILSIITSYVDGYSKEDLFVLITNQAIFLMYIGYVLISVSLNLLVENTVKAFFSSPLIQSIRHFTFITNVIRVNTPQSDIYHTQKQTKSFMKKAAIICGKLFNNRDDCDINIQQMVSETTNQSSEKMNPLILTFKSTDTEAKYNLLTRVVWLKFERRKQYFFFMMFEVVNLIIKLTFYGKIHFEGLLILNIVLIFFLALVQWWIASSKYEKHFFLINKILLALRVILHVAQIFDQLSNPINQSPNQLLVQQLYIFVIMFTRVSYPIITITIALIYTILFTIVQCIAQSADQYLVSNYCLINFMTHIVISSITYKLSYMERKDFILEKSLNQETSSNNNVLSILLPKFIRDRINQQGVFDFQENQGDVSIMFCDICNFDKIVAVENEKIVNLLDNLFRTFDLLCLQNGMQKIETVGKTYMAAGGLKAVDQNTRFQNINSVKRAINLSLEMMDYVKNFKFGEIGSIELKIGVHYGRVIAGVIGHHKPQFSLIGDTVNTTSRVCSTGVDGEITISEEAHEMVIMPELVFSKRIVNAKGKGLLTTYQVGRQGKRTLTKKMNRAVIPKMSSPERGSKEAQSPRGKLQKMDNQQGFPYYISDKKTSSQLIYVLGEKKELLENVQQRVRRVPTIIRRVSQQNRSIQNFSNQNLDLPSESQKLILLPRIIDIEESINEQQNQLRHLESQIRRDIIIENIDDNPEYEVEIDKVKIQFMNDEGDMSDVRGEILELDPRKLYLGFPLHLHAQVQEFYKRTSDLAFTSARFTLITTLISHSLKTLFTFTYKEISDDNFMLVALIVRISSSLVILLYSLLKKQRQIAMYTERFIILLFFAIFLGNLLESTRLLKPLQQIQAAEVLLLISQFSSFEIVKIANRLLLMTIFITCYSLWILVEFRLYSIVYYMLLWGFLQFLLQYTLFRSQINTFNNKINLEKKKSQSTNLIMHLLPLHVLEQIKQNSYSVGHADQLEEATVLFADIAGFTDYSSKVEPEQVVNMLRNLFTEFDKTCLIKNTYKLYTIGDCYVAVGVVNAYQRDPAKEAKNVVEMGFIMIDIIEQVRRIIGFDGLDMRIGIHTGHLIGGILGTDIVRYDIYGSDVMIANKMESNGEKGRVQISDETKVILEQNYPDEFEYQFNKSIDFSAIKRKTNGWFVLPSQDEHSSRSEGSEFGQQKGYLDAIRQVGSDKYLNFEQDPEMNILSVGSPQN